MSKRANQSMATTTTLREKKHISSNYVVQTYLIRIKWSYNYQGFISLGEWI